MSGVPYAAVLAGRDPGPVVATTAARLGRVYDSLSVEQAEVRPAPGKWNLREVMCHMADCEIAWSWRLRYAYEREHAVMQPFEQDPWAKMYAHYSLAEARAAFAGLRAWNVAFIGGLTEEDKRKAVEHPEIGGMTLWTLVEIMAGHDLHHLATLEAQS